MKARELYKELGKEEELTRAAYITGNCSGQTEERYHPV
jgi:hypothetical protein